MMSTDPSITNTLPLMTSSRLDPQVRTDQLTVVALSLAEKSKGGYRSVSRSDIAEAAGVAPSLVSARLGTMDNVRRAIMRHAIKTENIRVLAQGLAVGDSHARKAPDALRQKAAALIAG